MQRFFPRTPPPAANVYGEVEKDLKVTLATLTSAEIIAIIKEFHDDNPDVKFAALIVTGDAKTPPTPPGPIKPATATPLGSTGALGNRMLRVNDPSASGDILVSLSISPTRPGQD